ncbi:MAG: HEAT repeat domain-containing protein, partial [Planctomycetota bacterium]
MGKEGQPADSSTLGRICRLLEGPDVTLRRAAARVLAALQPESGEVVTALGRTLEAEDHELRRAALEAIRVIGREESYPYVVPLLDEEGDLGRRAMEVVAGMGRSVLPALRRRFGEAGLAGRRRILRIAARIQSPEAMDLILRALDTGYAEELREVGRRLAEELAPATSRTKTMFARRLRRFLTSGGPEKDPGGAWAALDLLERVLGGRALPELVEYSGPAYLPTVRRAALEALGRRTADGRLSGELCDRLLAYLGDPDYANVVAPAMRVLEQTALSAAQVPALLSHLKGHDPALRRFAIAALGQVDAPRSADALIEVLRGDNPDLRERAAESLARLKAAVRPSVEALLAAPDAARALRRLERSVDRLSWGVIFASLLVSGVLLRMNQGVGWL